MSGADEAGRNQVDADSRAEEAGTTVRREVSLDEAIAMAVLFLRAEQPEDAEKLLTAVLKVVPDHPVALHYSGVLAHQQQRHGDAIALIERSLQADPSDADWHSNLGIVLRAAGRPDEAMAAYARAIALNPGHAKAHNNLGVLQRKQGRLAEAEASYREAIRLSPEYADAYCNLGTVLKAQRRLPEAVEAYNKALVYSPATPETRRHLALAYCMLGESEKAVSVYEGWLREEPDNPVAQHMRSACSGAGVPERAADAYVRDVFDNFAASFDTKLARLEYRAPQLVAGSLEDAGVPAAGELNVLDAGCGTGLCGPLLRPYARRLVGVDLSPKMLANAEKRNVYDELVEAELTAYLAAHPASFDAVVSADTLVYFGVLEGVVAAAARALRPGGWMVFTVEALDEPAPVGFKLHYHGRYVHDREYVEEVLAHSGFRSEIAKVELRMEAGVPVPGFVVRARIPGGDPPAGERGDSAHDLS